MGVCTSWDIIQDKINEMFLRIELIKVYIDDLLIIIKSDWYDHSNKLELVLKKRTSSGLKCNIEKSFLKQTKIEYMGF